MTQSTKRRLDGKRLHWYMATVSVDYIEKEVVDGHETDRVFKRTQVINAILQQTTGRNIVARTMEAVRGLTLQRMETQYKMLPEQLLDFAVTNMIYMGHMSEREYYNTGQEKPANGVQ